MEHAKQVADSDLTQKKLRFLSLVLSIVSAREPKENERDAKETHREESEEGDADYDEEDDDEGETYKKKSRKRSESDDEGLDMEVEPEAKKDEEKEKKRLSTPEEDGLSTLLEIQLTPSLFEPTLTFLLSNLTRPKDDTNTDATRNLIDLDLLQTLYLLIRSVPSKTLELVLAPKSGDASPHLCKFRKLLWTLFTTKLPFKSLYLSLAIANHVISTIGWEWTAILDSEITDFGIVLSPFPSSVNPESPRTKLFETIVQRAAIEIDLGLHDVASFKEVEASKKAASTKQDTTTTPIEITPVDVASREEKTGVLLLSFSLLQSSLDFALTQLDDDEEATTKKSETSQPESEKFPTSVLLKVYELIKKYSELTIQLITIFDKRFAKFSDPNTSRFLDTTFEVPILSAGLQLVTRFLNESMDATSVKKMSEFLPFLAEVSEIYQELVPAFLELVLCLLKTEEIMTSELVSIKVTKYGPLVTKRETFINWLLGLSKATTTATTQTSDWRTRLVTAVATIVAIIVHNDDKKILQDSNTVILASGLCVDLVEHARSKLTQIQGKEKAIGWTVENTSEEHKEEKDELRREIEAIGYISYVLLEAIASPSPTSEFLKDSENILLHITEGLELMFKWCVGDFDEVQGDSLISWVLDTCTEICLENPKFRQLWSVWLGRALPSTSQNPSVQNFVKCFQ